MVTKWKSEAEPINRHGNYGERAAPKMGGKALWKG